MNIHSLFTNNNFSSVSFFKKGSLFILFASVSLLFLEQFSLIFYEITVFKPAFYLLGGVSVVFSVAFLAFQNHRWCIFDKILLFFFFWIILSSIVCLLSSENTCGFFFIFKEASVYFAFAGLYVCGRIISLKDAMLLLKFFVFACFILAFFSFFQSIPIFHSFALAVGIPTSFASLGWCKSVFLNPNHFAYLLSLVLPFVSGQFIFSNKLDPFSFFLFCFFALATICNRSSGAWLAFFSSLLLCFFIAHLITDKNAKSKTFLLLCCFILFSLFLESVNLSNITADLSSLSSTTAHTSSSENNLTVRLFMWKDALLYISEKPLFGFGPDGAFQAWFLDHGYLSDRCHNEYLQYGVFFGIPAMLSYIAYLISLFVFCLKNIKKASFLLLSLGISIFGYCISAFFGNCVYYVGMYFVIFLGILTSCFIQCNDNTKC